MIQLKTATDKNEQLTSDIKTISEKYSELEKKHANLESEILKIDVSKGPILGKKSIVVTDKMAIQTLGM